MRDGLNGRPLFFFGLRMKGENDNERNFIQREEER